LHVVSEFVFGTHNAAFVQVMYEQYLRDPASVGEEWRVLFDNGKTAELPIIPTERSEVIGRGALDVGRDATPSTSAPTPHAPRPTGAEPITGPAARLVQNMTESLTVPTATSFRDIAVGTLDSRRKALNAQLAASGKKVSFTHLIAFAIVQAVKQFPVMTHAFQEIDGKPHRVTPPGIGLGLAVDVERKDGTRGLVVPVIKHAEGMDFAAFHQAYEALVEKARTNKLLPDDFAGGTIQLTNPGTIGTVASVPRLMKGQGSIIATGAIRDSSGGGAKVMTITSTYDHRIIQGAESGSFLRHLDSLLQGEQRFYEEIVESLGVGRGALDVSQPHTPHVPRPTSADDLKHVAAATALVRAIRRLGHRAAHLDPLGSPPPGDPSLDPAPLGLTPETMARIPADVLRCYVPGATLADALPQLTATYCGTIAYEVEHIASHEERVWLRRVIESGEHRKALSAADKRSLLTRLTLVDTLERFLQRAYLGQKRFSIEGVDMTVPMLDTTLELAAAFGAHKVVMGMAHRGRLNVLAHVVSLPYEAILEEFEGGGTGPAADPEAVTGDVKYHLGAEGTYKTTKGKEVTVSLLSNPSHLEAVNPVVEGWTRAEQTDRSGGGAEPTYDVSTVLPLLIHGDAAFAGQGVVAETFNLARLRGYTTGGTIHLITNNQIGFTTDPRDGRSTDYSSDLAKGFDVPIIHVNADDPEACIAAVRLAWMYRERFHGDVVIDLVGYRRWGHNEGDEPAYTQPLMYDVIKQTPPVREKYAAQLAAEGLVTPEAAKQEADAAYARLTEVQQTLKARRSRTSGEERRIVRAAVADPETAVPVDVLKRLNDALLTVPDGFTVHPKLKRQLERRRETIVQGGMEWAHAEALAFGSLLAEGSPIRLTGQDAERGTFSQRHLVLHDPTNDQRWAPIQHVPGARAPFELHNSPLSEAACLGFEYGYATAAHPALVLWEAQYGDFANGAEVIIDQFIVAGLAKWGDTSRLTLLLPHGYEGGGPEHSSARLERFLALGAEGNIRVANCTTPAQYFHLLRRQARHEEIRPLVVMTPKGLLRLPAATSKVEDLAQGRFRAVLWDAERPALDQVTRLILCSGKVYYDLTASPRRAETPHIALGRVELLYPFPSAEIGEAAARYANLKEVVWVQEEPRNMGARKFVLPKLRDVIPEATVLRDVSRPERSSPAEGYPAAHKAEQDRIVAAAYGNT
jgi:2-oxoglutarate dehydrogenase E1 component